MSLQIKMFCDSSIEKIENEINQWLVENSVIEIISITQSESKSGGKINGEEMGIVISVVYRRHLWMEKIREGN